MPEMLPPGPSLSRRVPLSVWDGLDWSSPEDMHMHTTYVDGKASVAAMAAAARVKGLKRILLTEHVRAASTYFPDFVAEIRALEEQGLQTFVGAETKICSLAGDLDITTEHAHACDAIVGSVHRPPAEYSNGSVKWNTLPQDFARDLEFKLALAIVEKSQASILGHPMGMSITAFDAVPEQELRDLADACAMHGKAFEINVRYCPHPKLWMDIVRAARCLVTIASDAHSPEELGKSWAVFAALRDD